MSWTPDVPTGFGTNVRVLRAGAAVEFRGCTETANLPTFLATKPTEMFSVAMLRDVFGNSPMTLHGEGYGAKIQHGSELYIAGRLGIEHALRVGEGPLLDAISLTREGFASQMRSTAPEGLIMRPPVERLSRRGERIIASVKLEDSR